MRPATRQSSTIQRTAPYLGVACLALLALASVHGFAPTTSAAAARRPPVMPTLSWLAAPATPQPLFAGTQWAGHASELATTRAAFALACTALLVVVLALLAQRLRQAAPRTQGSLSISALLIALALARAH